MPILVSGNTMNIINKCLLMAGKHDGSIFGGFLRDVSIPFEYDPKCSVNFNDIDIWFTTEKKCTIFYR